MAEHRAPGGVLFAHRFMHFADPPPSVEDIANMTMEGLLDVNTCNCGCTPIGHWLKSDITVDALTLWLDRAPQAISIQNDHGNIALSQVSENAPEEQALLVASRTPPEALLFLDADGDTPFHCVLQNRASDCVLRACVEQCPIEVFSIVNNDGRLPIHEAVENGAALDILKSIVDRSPSDALETADSKGKLPVHLLTSHSSQEVADFLVRLSPSNSLLQEDNSGMIPLHCALFSNASAELIATLVEKAPSSVYKTDGEGRLPLSILLGRSRSIPFPPTLTTLLLGAKPRLVLRTRNKRNSLPLAIAIRRGTHRDTVAMLLDYSPPNILTSNICQGRNPLAYAIESSSSLEIVQLLVNQSALYNLPQPDVKGKVPLHYIRKSTSLEIVELLVEKSPGMLSTRDTEGKLPIHYAVHRGALLPVVEFMVQSSPMCLSVADNHGQLPIHIMESTCDDVKLILIQQCAAEDLMRADKDGRLPLHRALKSHNLPTKLLQLLVDRCPAALFHFDSSGQLPLLQAISGGTRKGLRLSRRIHPLGRVLQLPRAMDMIWASEPTRTLATVSPPAFLSVVSLLAEHAPETIKIVDPSGKVLLHHLCEYKLLIKDAELLVRLCPDGLGVSDLEGRCPLHYALEKDCSAELVQVFLKGFPGAVTLRDKQGRLPLYIACNARASLDVIFDLIRWSPELLCGLDIHLL